MTTNILPKLTRRPKRSAQVIFNAGSGDAAQSDDQLALILQTLLESQIDARVLVVRPSTRIPQVAARAAQQGIHYLIACGGDNTIDLVARGLVGTRTALVIVPTGTRNNIARALDIPSDVAAATRLVESGTRTRLDMGRVRLMGRETHFLELLTIGLGAAMFPALDDAQKGNLGRIGDLLGTFISHPAATFYLNLDRGRQKISVDAFTLLVLNMPFLGANFQIAPNVDGRDGLLDVFLYADLGKLDLLTHALQVAQGFTDDPRVRHLRVRHLEIETDPPMPVMLDGNVLKENVLRRRGLQIACAPNRLNVMLPR